MTEPTARQLEVFLTVCRLDSEKAAAHELGISRGAVKNHNQRLYQRLGVNGRTQALIALGYLVLPPDLGTSIPIAAGGYHSYDSEL